MVLSSHPVSWDSDSSGQAWLSTPFTAEPSSWAPTDFILSALKGSMVEFVFQVNPVCFAFERKSRNAPRTF